ncbi:MAG: metal ABC transporter ATP-binding protein [Parcubacteria group bacterium]
MSTKVVELDNVGVELAGRPVVEGVSFSVDPGEIVGIIGPNGGGKSTLLKAILGLLPYSGRITLAPQTRIGYVPQYFDFDRTLPLTVRELFRVRLYGKLTARRGDQETKRLLDGVGAKKVLSKRLGVLSGGELQRVLIALALAGKPTILILDEPSSGIDIGGEETIYNLIKRLAEREKLTILFVSHDLDVVYRYATQALCLNRRMTCHGSPGEVLTEETIAHTHGTLTRPFRHRRHT